MYGIDILMEEHQNILKLIGMMRRSCKEVLDGAPVDVALFRQYLECARKYADYDHHGKEEKILFRIMVDQLGAPAQKLVTNGMLVEHDWGRLHLAQLEEALDAYEAKKESLADCKLDILTSVGGYCNLLQRHIDKEDQVVYTFAQRMLSDAWKQTVDEETKAFEQDEEHAAIKAKYEAWIDQMLNKQ